MCCVSSSSNSVCAACAYVWGLVLSCVAGPCALCVVARDGDMLYKNKTFKKKTYIIVARRGKHLRVSQEFHFLPFIIPPHMYPSPISLPI